MYTLGEFAKLVGVVPKTLQRWDREGRLKAHRTVTNQRYFTDEDLTLVLGLEKSPQKKRCLVYCRVSSPAQKPDLMNQRHHLEQFCAARGLVVDEWLEEIGGGLNFERKKFLAVVDRIIAGDVGMLVIAHRDRLARFGFPLIEHLCEMHQCELLVMNTPSLSPEQELTQDLLTILHCFSSRLYGLGNYRKTVKEALAHGNDHNQSPQDSPAPNA
ncbi:IS607 family transposase [Dictyobacter aurantiacus]|uniref:IS607 family transposase n=1 Tax=Dictyobacter aurantiacus TaxID=1936993 RepID=UPI000F842B6C|nr:IS607 family transposase [Dictyobacter aurantiacus]